MQKFFTLFKKKLFLLCILFFNYSYGTFSDGKSFFYSKSQFNFDFNDVFFDDKKNRLIIDNKVVYKKSFDSSGLGKYFFGKNKLVFTGSRVKNRGKTDILADYFGLPFDFHSIVTYKPIVDTFSYELSSSVNLDFLCKDVYAKISFPYVYTKWNLNIKEKLLNKGSQPYPAGYMSAGNKSLPRSQLVKNVKEYFQGNVFFGDMQEHLAYGKIDGAKDAIGVADIHILFAGRVIKKENSYCNLLLKIIAPTGRSSSAEYLFEPCLGNGYHWQIGVGFSGKSLLKEYEGNNTKWEFSYSGLISHLFTSKQKRSFDLNNGSGSRYMLLEAFDNPLDTPFTIFLQAPTGQASQYQYKGQLFPAINKTTFDCHIVVPIEANFMVQLSYAKNNWNINGGYNVWVRSGEKINKREKLIPNIFGIKGDSQVYGHADTGGGVQIGFPLAATQSKATLCKGQGNGNIHTPLLATDFTNQNIDNPALAVANVAPVFIPPVVLNQFEPADATALGLALAQVNSSSPSILLKDADINEKSGLSSVALSNKLFVDFIFEKKYKDYNSYINFGVDIEISSSLKGKKSVLSQWSLWLKYSILCE